MLSVAKALKNAASVDVIAGYRDKELFLAEDLSQYAPVHIATEDGSAGTKGTVIDAIEAERLKADVIFACGPMPMLRAIKKYAIENGMQRWCLSGLCREDTGDRPSLACQECAHLYRWSRL